jgi:hypothetical protein
VIFGVTSLLVSSNPVFLLLSKGNNTGTSCSGGSAPPAREACITEHQLVGQSHAGCEPITQITWTAFDCPLGHGLSCWTTDTSDPRRLCSPLGGSSCALCGDWLRDRDSFTPWLASSGSGPSSKSKRESRLPRDHCEGAYTPKFRTLASAHNLWQYSRIQLVLTFSFSQEV